MKAKKKPPEPKAPPKGSKALRTARRKAYYAAQFMRTETNKRRRMRTHLRNHPGDGKTAALYEKKYGGRVTDFGLTGRGKRRVIRALIAEGFAA